MQLFAPFSTLPTGGSLLNARSHYKTEVKKPGTPHTIALPIQARGGGYNPSKRQCCLCLLEKWHTLHPSMVSSRLRYITQL